MRVIIPRLTSLSHRESDASPAFAAERDPTGVSDRAQWFRAWAENGRFSFF